MRFEYRNVTYTIEWVAGIAHYTVRVRRQIFRGEGNHGAAKAVIDRYVQSASSA
jgi:hypothetical protein